MDLGCRFLLVVFCCLSVAYAQCNCLPGQRCVNVNAGHGAPIWVCVGEVSLCKFPLVWDAGLGKCVNSGALCPLGRWDPVLKKCIPDVFFGRTTRLTDASGLKDQSRNGEGLLQVSKEISGTWGTVCDDGFTKTNAEVVCKTLGYTGGIMTDASTSSLSSTVQIHMDNVACNGTESSIVRCGSNGWDVHNCQHSEDVHIRCDGALRLTDAAGEVEQTASGYGLLQVFYRGSWGSVCDDLFDNKDVTVACKQMGFSSGVMTSDDGSKFDGPILMDDIRCDGDEQRLDSCVFAGWGKENCGHSEDVYLRCATDDQDVCTPSPCKNGGTCRPLGDSFACQCPTGYTGRYCETKVVNKCTTGDHTCTSLETCMPTMQGGFKCLCGSATCTANSHCYRPPTCRCDAGYTMSGSECVDINECVGKPCQATEMCINTDGGFRCVDLPRICPPPEIWDVNTRKCECPRGWIRIGTGKCLDISIPIDPPFPIDPSIPIDPPFPIDPRPEPPFPGPRPDPPFVAVEPIALEPIAPMRNN